MTPESLVEYVRKVAVDRIRPKLEPDQDWQACLFLWNGELSMVALLFRDEVEKERSYREFAPSAIENTGASLVGTVNTVWMVDGKAAGELVESGGRARNHPDRFEALCIAAHDWHGNATSWTGRIVRVKHGPPLVEEVERPTHTVRGDVAGWLGDALARNKIRARQDGRRGL